MKQTDILKNNDKLVCDCGSQPSDLKILKKRFTVNGNIVATNEDNVAGINIQSFGSCKFGGSCKLNSELMGSKLEWTNYIKNIKLMVEYKLDNNSICNCPLGGKIKKL